MNEPVLRRYTFKLYPNAAQAAALTRQSQMMAELWNAALQRCEDVYRRERRHLSAYELNREIKYLRAASPEWRALSACAPEMVIFALRDAFKAFFRRAQAGAGAASGYPRFKRVANGAPLLFRDAPFGWSFAARGKSFRLRIKGLEGLIEARGRFPLPPQSLRGASVFFRDGAWWISVCARLPARAAGGTEEIEIRFDLIDQFARVTRVEGGPAACPQGQIIDGYGVGELGDLAAQFSEGGSGDPAGGRTWLAERSEDEPGVGSSAMAFDTMGRDSEANRSVRSVSSVGALQSARDRRFKRFSWRWRRESRRIARAQARAARQRREALHLWSSALVARACDLTVIAPSSIAALTKTPRGNVRAWGASVKTVSALNRFILDQAPGTAIAMLAYKAAEAAIRFAREDDADPDISVGRDLVATGIAARRTRRIIKREMQYAV